MIWHVIWMCITGLTASYSLKSLESTTILIKIKHLVKINKVIEKSCQHHVHQVLRLSICANTL